MELSQALTSLSAHIRMAEGCRRCDFCRSVEDEDRLFLIEEWDNRETVTMHLKSKHFKVLRGAMSLLKEPYEMTFYTVFHPEGTEGI